MKALIVSSVLSVLTLFAANSYADGPTPTLVKGVYYDVQIDRFTSSRTEKEISALLMELNNRGGGWGNSAPEAIVFRTKYALVWAMTGHNTGDLYRALGLASAMAHLTVNGTLDRNPRAAQIKGLFDGAWGPVIFEDSGTVDDDIEGIIYELAHDNRDLQVAKLMTNALKSLKKVQSFLTVVQ